MLSRRTQRWLGLAGIAASLVAAPAIAQAKETIEGCANGETARVHCEGSAWVTGSLNAAKSRYREGDFVPFRVTIDGLRAGNHYTLQIGYDAVEGGLHAYDYLGSFDATRNGDQRIVPCDAVAGTSGAHACGSSSTPGRPSTVDVPTDTGTDFPSEGQLAGEFSAWGVSLTSADYDPDPPSPTIGASTGGTVERRIDLRFAAEGPVAVIAWGGHIASIVNWGPGRTFAEAGSGAPFHMRLKNAGSFNPGQQDVSLHVAALAPRPSPFTTQVDSASVEVGAPVTDTARLGPPVPSGSVRFFVCGPATGAPPDCTLGGNPVGHAEVVTAGGTAAIQFRPEAEGVYCFRAEYHPGDTALFSPATHTDQALGGECFTARPAPPPPPPPGPGTLTVIKSCVPASDRGRFTVTIRGAGRTIRRTLRCGGTIGPVELAAGTYRVTERGAGGTNLANYDREIGGDCGAGGRVQIADGDSATCTINNVRRPQEPKVGHLTLHKLCVPSTDQGRFNLRIDGITAGDSRCGGMVGPVALRPGTYKVAESAGTGTDLSAYRTVIGGACGADGSITLRPQESATCTITNVRVGTPTAVVTVVKQCSPADDPGRFTLDVDEQELSGMRCGQSTGPITVATGKHLVGEVATSGVVDDYSTELGGDCAATGTTTLAADQHATCTVTNTRIQHAPAIRPASACYTLSVSPRTLRAGRRGTVEARAAVRGAGVRGVLVRLAGAGIARSGRTGAAGVLRIGLLPTAAGTIAVTTPRQFGCPAVLARHIAVRGGRPAVTG